MSYYDSEIADRAVSALRRWTRRIGAVWQEPDGALTETMVVGGCAVVHVRNCNGLLARYAELPSGRLRRLL